MNTKERINQIGLSQLLSSQLQSRSTSDEINLNLTTLKQYLGNTNNNHNNQRSNQKPISINNLVFKENNSSSRILSAKSTTKQNDKLLTNFDFHIQPASPVQFQSLQSDIEQQSTQTKLVSPVSVNNLMLNGNNNVTQYTSNQHKRNTNILGLQQVATKTNTKQK